MPMRIIQLTDCHLLADADARLKGVPTRASLAAVLDLVRREFVDFDYLVITGDLAHDERRETYAALADMLGDWLPRCRLIPGNHDNRAAMREVFPEIIPPAAPVPPSSPAGEPPITFSLAAGAWRLIGLDSHIPGRLPGRLEPPQLDWLEGELRAADAPTLLFVHHPPVAVGSPWLDRIGLESPERFNQIVASSSQVRAIFTGHVHQEFQGRLHQALVVSAPSTAVQFRPGTAELECDFLPLGFRLIELEGESFRHCVVRLEELAYPPGV